MGADFRSLLQHANRQFPPGLVRELLQPDGRRQPRRPSADDDDVIGHRIPFAHNPSIPSTPWVSLPIRSPRYTNVLPLRAIKTLANGVNLWTKPINSGINSGNTGGGRPGPYCVVTPARR